MKNSTVTPRIYVGTYAKYNNGSITGEWLELSAYADKEEFLEACAKLHSEESDPEFMFQDMEGIPDGMATESSISDELWDWLALDEDDRELLAVYRDNVNQSGDIDEARDAFAGKCESEEDWASEFLDDTGFFDDIPKGIRETVEMYFDFAAYARDARLNGDITFVEYGYRDIWVFRNC